MKERGKFFSVSQWRALFVGKHELLQSISKLLVFKLYYLKVRKMKVISMCTSRSLVFLQLQSNKKIGPDGVMRIGVIGNRLNKIKNMLDIATIVS